MDQQNTIQKPMLGETAARSTPYRGFIARNARVLMALVLMVSDLLALFLSGALAIFIWSYVRADLVPANYVALIPLALVFLLVFLLTGLYPAVGMSPVEEFRRLILATTGGFLGMGTLSFYMRDVEAWSRASFGLAWVFALFLIPLARELIRLLFCRRGWWGERAAIIGYGPRGHQITEYLLANPKLGIRPVVAINGFQKVTEPEGGFLGLEWRQNLLDVWQQRAKWNRYAGHKDNKGSKTHFWQLPRDYERLRKTLAGLSCLVTANSREFRQFDGLCPIHSKLSKPKLVQIIHRNTEYLGNGN